MQTSDKNDIEGLRDAIRVLTPNFQTWIGAALDELVSLRAQADARPVAMEYVAVADDGGKLSWVSGRKPRDCALYAIAPTNSGLAPAFYVTSVLSAQAAADVSEIYTHPEASADLGMNAEEREALRNAVNRAKESGDNWTYDTLRAFLKRTNVALSCIPPEASAPGLSEDEWLALAERHIRADWNSEQPDGYLNAVKALVQDAVSLTRASAATVAEPTHPDDAAVDRFAAAMKQKLAQAREKGRGGWQQCDPVELSIMLREHVEKGDPRDVANFCMFLWHHGVPISDAALPYGKRAAQQQAEPCPESAMCPACYYGEPMESCIGKQAEPGADERAAFEAWASKRRMDLRREANNPDEYLLASTADAFVGWQAHAAQSGQRAGEEFQARVQPWMMACFGPEIAADTQERNHRFLEEALELVQACGATASEAHQLVDYVYGRPVGDKHQEIGGVMVTLAALCLAQGQNMHAAGETELARIWTKVEQIRAKQAAKPKHSPLPEHPVGQRAGVAEEQAWRDVLAERVRQMTHEGWTPAHDDAHTQMEMAEAAAVYALDAAGWTDWPREKFWPWAASWWKPTTPRRNMVKAGALILAEIERLDRAAAPTQQQEGA